MNLPSEPSEPRTYRFEIFRYDESCPQPPRFQAYELSANAGGSLLDALLKIQDEQEPSLAFRYACRGLVCGSCAMVVNGCPTLACRTQLADLPTNRVVIEPLSGFDIIKDLVVDMDPFWEKYAQVQPWLQAEGEEPSDTRMSERQRERIDQFANCILCGLCHSACPAVAMNDDFTGPAALAKLYRFLADSRESRGPQTVKAQNRHAGAWGCRTATRCIDVCPKNVRPFDGIAGVRRRIVTQALSSLLGFRRHEE